MLHIKQTEEDPEMWRERGRLARDFRTHRQYWIPWVLLLQCTFYGGCWKSQQPKKGNKSKKKKASQILHSLVKGRRKQQSSKTKLRQSQLYSSQIPQKSLQPYHHQQQQTLKTNTFSSPVGVKWSLRYHGDQVARLDFHPLWAVMRYPNSNKGGLGVEVGPELLFSPILEAQEEILDSIYSWN